MPSQDDLDLSPLTPFNRGVPRFIRPPGWQVGAGALGFAALFLFIFIWFFCRIEPASGEIAILIRKTGEDLPSGQILAENPDQKGIQKEVLPEGRYFRNPYSWNWEIARMTDIPAGRLGVLVRLHGRDLPPGRIIAEEGTKGIVAEVLRPGKYRINPYAYLEEQFDAISVRPGYVGVVTSLVGDDVLNNDLPKDQRNGFLVPDTQKGIMTRVLDPGTYYVNPYMVNVVEVNLQSQRFEMSGSDVISFLTLDGFTVEVEGTIEYGLEREKAALLTHRVGDMQDIIRKVILPRARGFSRIEGSKHPAINFIVGETRQKFQSDLEGHLRDKSVDWGVDIKSVLIRKIAVPDEIASISREREVAVQDSAKYAQQIEQAKSKAELGKQEMLAQQNKEKVEADTARIRAVINAQQGQAVRIVGAEQGLQVAKVNLQAAQFQAQSLLLKAAGERDGIRARNEAEAGVVAAQVKAFGSGMTFARYEFYRKLAPALVSILGSDQADGLGALLKSFLLTGKEESR